MTYSLPASLKKNYWWLAVSQISQQTVACIILSITRVMTVEQDCSMIWKSCKTSEGTNSFLLYDQQQNIITIGNKYNNPLIRNICQLYYLAGESSTLGKQGMGAIVTCFASITIAFEYMALETLWMDSLITAAGSVAWTAWASMVTFDNCHIAPLRQWVLNKPSIVPSPQFRINWTVAHIWIGNAPVSCVVGNITTLHFSASQDQNIHVEVCVVVAAWRVPRLFGFVWSIP